MLEKIDKVVQRNYHPWGYERMEFKQAYLFWKLGGACAADIAYQAMGVPSTDVTRKSINITPLLALPSHPMLAEIEYNLNASSFGSPSLLKHRESITFNNDPILIGMTMPMDKIKLQERLHWDPAHQ